MIPTTEIDPDNYRVFGLEIAEGAGFSKAPSDGAVMMGGVGMTVTGLTTHTFTPQRVTYRDLQSDGEFNYLEVYFDEPAFAPAVTNGALRIGLTKTDLTGVTEDRILIVTVADFGPNNQAFPDASVVPPIPPEDDVANKDYKTMGYSGHLGDPVFLAADGMLYLYDGTKNAADRYVGILDGDYATGAWARYGYSGALITGLSGLVVGHTVYAVTGGLLIHKEDFDTPTYERTYAREVATPLSATSLRVLRGEMLPEDPTFFVAIAGENLPDALVPMYLAADGKAYICQGDEVSITACAGLLETAVASGAVARILLPGNVISGFAGLTMEKELWANLGTLKYYSAVGSGNWTVSVGYPKSSTELNFIIGTPLMKFIP